MINKIPKRCNHCNLDNFEIVDFSRSLWQLRCHDCKRLLCWLSEDDISTLFTIWKIDYCRNDINLTDTSRVTIEDLKEAMKVQRDVESELDKPI